MRYTGYKQKLVELLVKESGQHLNPWTGTTQKLQFATFKPILNAASERDVLHALACIRVNEWDQSELLMNQQVWK